MRATTRNAALIISLFYSFPIVALTGKGTRQCPFKICARDLPLTIKKSGFYRLGASLLFDGAKQTARGIRGPIAISVSAANVDIDLANKTLFLTVSGNTPQQVNGIATLNNSSNVTIHDGSIIGVGNNFAAAAGILILTDDVTVKNVQVRDIFTLPGILAAGLGLESSGIFIQGNLFPSPTSNTFLFQTLYGVTIDHCQLSHNGAGISIANHASGITVKDCTIDLSTSFGIWEPQRSDFSSNVLIERCSIANTNLAGIFATFNQTNWRVQQCKIFNCGLSGITIQGSQNFTISECDIFNCGAYGILQSIRNVITLEISDTKVTNTLYETIRIDNAENLRLVNCQCTNQESTFTETINGVTVTGLPLNVNNTSYPIVTLQDVTNAIISGVQISSTTGTSDGLRARNCSSLAVEDCVVNIYATKSSNHQPVGINFLGGVLNSTIKNCVIGGSLAIGINLSQDQDPLALPPQTPSMPLPPPTNLNGFDSAITIEKCSIANASQAGINLSSASNNVIIGNKIINCLGDGIFIDANSFNNSIRRNTLLNNNGFGINTQTLHNQIFSNFAANNTAGNYSANLVASGFVSSSPPSPSTPPLINISGDIA